jgi:hypothetical protein
VVQSRLNKLVDQIIVQQKTIRRHLRGQTVLFGQSYHVNKALMQQWLTLKMELDCLYSETYAVFDDLFKKAEFHETELPRQQPVLNGRQGTLKPYKTKGAV